MYPHAHGTELPSFVAGILKGWSECDLVMMLVRLDLCAGVPAGDQLRQVVILPVLHVRISLCFCGPIMCLASGRCSVTHGEAEKNSVLVAICFHLLFYATPGCHRPTSRVTLPAFKAPDAPPSIATIR